MAHLGEYIEQIHREQKNAVIEELEKLKAEFEEDKYILLNQTTVIKVIDNYISEMKGENNGNDI